MGKNKKRGGAKKKQSSQQTIALKAINEWVYCQSNYINNNGDDGDGFLPKVVGPDRNSEKVVFELHSHSSCSDGFLSPSALVAKAHHFGVKVLALTDHDTLSGVPEALEAARKFGMKIIPGVEISSVLSRQNSKSEESVHILAYYGSCGPTNFEEFDKFLTNIRDGRYLRAKSMISKLKGLKKPVKWEHVTRIAGDGVAPGRLHVARALVEAGHVEDTRQAFARYLSDDGPAYARGNEPSAEEAVQMICKTGGIAVLAHPWSLKDPTPIVKRLKGAGLHGIEVYRSDGKLAAFGDLADAYGLLKLGGSDFHGRGDHRESSLGSISLPVSSVHDLLRIARPIWRDAVRNIVERYVEEPCELNLEHITRFGKVTATKSYSPKELINRCLSSMLTEPELQHADFQAIMSKVSDIIPNSEEVLC